MGETPCQTMRNNFTRKVLQMESAPLFDCLASEDEFTGEIKDVDGHERVLPEKRVVEFRSGAAPTELMRAIRQRYSE